MPQSIPVLSETATALCIVFILLVPLSIAGIALVNTGLGRSRSAAHSMLASLCVVAVAAITYLIVGFAWQGFADGPQHVSIFHGKTWGWIAAEHLFLRGVKLDGSAPSLIAWLQIFSVGLVALIPLGAGSDRWKLGASIASTALLAGWTYPLFAHWAWGGGWLAQLGENCGLGRGFVDAGGSGSIHVVGGLTALSIAWILGPRRGKYSMDGLPAAIPGHNAVVVLFGCLLALPGWIGLNSAGAILFNGIPAAGAVLIAINTALSAAAAGLTSAVVTRIRFRKPDASLAANGWVGGLVASSAGCAFLAPATAILIGIVAGALVPLTVELLELRLSVDDPGGVIPVHGVAGIWGILAVGLFAHLSGNSPALGGAGAERPGQFLAQLIGVATLLGFVLPTTYGLNWLLNRFYPQRVTPEGERKGLDLEELGAGAYPDFVTHTDEHIPR